MSEFRKDPVSEHWVIMVAESGSASRTIGCRARGRMPQRCPFCRGHEQDTPPEVAAYGPDGGVPESAAWQVRVIPNKYPAVLLDPQGNEATDDFYESLRGIGVHEVIVETPDHVSHFSALEDASAVLVFLAYRDRLAALSATLRLAYGQIF